MYPPGSFANWSKQIVELLPALKDTFDKDKVLVTCLASLLELIRDEKLDPTQFLPYLLFADSIFLRQARATKTTPPPPHKECLIFQGILTESLTHAFSVD